MKKTNLLRMIILVFFAILFTIPLYVTVINAFKPKHSILANPLGIPISELTFNNLIDYGFSKHFNVLYAYLTTSVIVIVSTIFIVIFSAMLAYVMVRTPRSRFLKFFYILLLAGMIIPPQAILLSVVQILRATGLMFTLTGLIIRNIGWYIPFMCFLYVGYIKTIPKELDESAYVDGAGQIYIFYKIIFPLIKPATASAVILNFLWIWNDFVNPQIILGSEFGYTITTGIYRAVGQFNTAWDQIFTLVLWASIPVLIVYLFMQKNFISGLTAGSIKG